MNEAAVKPGHTQRNVKRGRSKTSVSTQIVSFHVPRALLEELDELIRENYFTNRSEAFRTGLLLLIREVRLMEKKRVEIRPITALR